VPVIVTAAPTAPDGIDKLEIVGAAARTSIAQTRKEIVMTASLFRLGHCIWAGLQGFWLGVREQRQLFLMVFGK